MANELRYVITKKEDGTYAGFKALKDDMEGFEPGRWLITIKRYRRSRSNAQNAFYHFIFLQSEIDCFKEYWGETYSKTQMHDWNKGMFWGEEKLIESTGEIIKVPGSSADKTTVEFEERLEIARQWFLNTFNWVIQLPNEQGEINY